MKRGCRKAAFFHIEKVYQKLFFALSGIFNYEKNWIVIRYSRICG
jgi:hypothetical protein